MSSFPRRAYSAEQARELAAAVHAYVTYRPSLSLRVLENSLGLTSDALTPQRITRGVDLSQAKLREVDWALHHHDEAASWWRANAARQLEDQARVAVVTHVDVSQADLLDRAAALVGLDRARFVRSAALERAVLLLSGQAQLSAAPDAATTNATTETARRLLSGTEPLTKAEIAMALDCTNRHALRLVTNLSRVGVPVVVGRRGRANTYHIAL